MPLSDVKIDQSLRFSGKAAFAHRQSIIEVDIHEDDRQIFMMTELKLGSDRHAVDLIIDTGSTALWINREDCGDDPIGLLGDCRIASNPRTLSYLDGTIEGKEAKTSIWLEKESRVSPNHDIVVIDKKSSLMNYGIIGLARAELEETSYMKGLKLNGIIAEEAFAIYRSGDRYELILGGVDRSLVKPNAIETVAQMINPDAYYINVDGAMIEDSLVTSRSTNALIDSGNTLISFPGFYSNDFIRIMSAKGINCMLIDEQNAMFKVLACQLDPNAKFPDISFTINGVKLTIPGSVLVGECVDIPVGNLYDDRSVFACYIKIEFFMRADYFTLGKTFLEKVYTTFNLDKQTITFIQNAD